MMNSTWVGRFRQMSEVVAEWSRDPSTKVGAVIVDENKIVRGVGFNGFPRGIRDTDERLNNRDMKYKLTVHAETNALLNTNGSVRGCTLFCTKHPCSTCATLIIQAGISRVCCPPGGDDRWAVEQALACSMLCEVGIEIVFYTNAEALP